METEIKVFEEKIKAIMERLRQELISLRGDRPSAKMFEDIAVEYYEKLVPIKQLALVSILPPRDVTISVWDGEATKKIAKAIEDAGLGVTPNIEKNTIRLTLPALTNERREELVKILKKTMEQYRIRLRAARDEVNKKIDKAEERGDIAEDSKFRLRERVQKSITHTNEEIERISAQKENDIMN